MLCKPLKQPLQVGQGPTPALPLGHIALVVGQGVSARAFGWRRNLCVLSLPANLTVRSQIKCLCVVKRCLGWHVRKILIWCPIQFSS